jgi:hypothetical protein
MQFPGMQPDGDINCADFGFWVFGFLGFKFWALVFGLWDLGFGFWFLGFGFRV